MKKLIINADDFGFSEGHNYGIIHAYTKGLVTSTTIMANMPGFEHAVALAKQHPGLKVGVHLNLTCYKPIGEQVSSLVDERGYFKGEDHLESYDTQEMIHEVVAQIKRVLDAGLSIDHFDSHHHIHTQRAMEPIMQALLQTYPYPIRGGLTYDLANAKCAIMLNQFYNQQATKDDLCQLLQELEEGKVYDLMCHPAYIDPTICQLSSYVIQRVKELDILCDEDIKKLIQEENITLINYSEF